jgi:hypothetical protein
MPNDDDPDQGPGGLHWGDDWRPRIRARKAARRAGRVIGAGLTGAILGSLATLWRLGLRLPDGSHPGETMIIAGALCLSMLLAAPTSDQD